jgi:hypothetical protein
MRSEQENKLLKNGNEIIMDCSKLLEKEGGRKIKS